MKILSGHVSPETAYVVDDYPYGFRLRCKIRYWLEHHPKRGTRFWSQTTNPKRGGPGEVWNKPKASTFSDIAGCMFSDESGHIHWTGLNTCSSSAEVSVWLNTYRYALDAAALDKAEKWLATKLCYDTARADGFPSVAATCICHLVGKGKPYAEAAEQVKTKLAALAADRADAPISN